MRLTEEQLQEAVALAESGLSWRKVAKEMGLAKSTVSDNLRRYYAEEETEIVFETEGPKILFLDIETAPAIAAAFGRHKVFLTQDHILAEGGTILCVGYKWLGEDEVTVDGIKGQTLLNCDDSHLVATIWELFEQADAVVAHNSRGFDVPMIRARVLYHGLPDLPHVKVIDTLQMAKKNFRLPNNKLDSICAFLGLARKKDPGGIETWLQYMMGEPEAVATMHDYCAMDVALLERVYMAMRSFGHAGTDFNVGHYFDDGKVHCHICGSTELEDTGRSIFTAVSEFKEVRCGDCGAVGRKRQPINSREQRQNVIVQPRT